MSRNAAGPIVVYAMTVRTATKTAMKDKPQEFAIRKDRRNLPRVVGRLPRDLFKFALLVTALGFYCVYNHSDPGVGPIFPSERQLATANSSYFVSAFGLSGCAALIAAWLKALRVRAEVHLRKHTTQIPPKRFDS